MEIDKPSVAIYWDFENIHASLIDQLKGVGTYRQSRFTPQDPVVNVAALMEFCASFGSVAINRAYGNWQWFARYREALLHNAVELIQLFPPGAAAKNGADIKLCLDATEDMIRFPHLTTLVIIGADSDFLPVSQKIKAAGRTLVGVGIEAATNRHWAHSCHEFRYYERLVAEETAPLEETSDDRGVVVAGATGGDRADPPCDRAAGREQGRAVGAEGGDPTDGDEARSDLRRAVLRGGDFFSAAQEV